MTRAGREHSMEAEQRQDDTDGTLSNVCQVYCGQSFNERGTIAPCAMCEWCGICPQHYQTEN